MPKGHSLTKLDELNDADSQTIFKKRYGNLEYNEWAANSILARCGGIPLAAQVMADVAREIGLSHAHDLLANADINQAKTLLKSYESPEGRCDEEGNVNLFLVFGISVDNLSDTAGTRTRYLRLAAIPEKAKVPTKALQTIWRCSPASVAMTVSDLLKHSLVNYEDETLFLHDMLQSYLLCRAKRDGSLKGQHENILSAYAEKCLSDTGEGSRKGEPVKWWEGPDDGYFYDNLLYHLDNATRKEEVNRLLQHYSLAAQTSIPTWARSATERLSRRVRRCYVPPDRKGNRDVTHRASPGRPMFPGPHLGTPRPWRKVKALEIA